MRRQQGVLLTLALAATAAGAVAVPRTSPGPLDGLRFMAGCWQGPGEGSTIIEEYYTPPSANLILGMTRYLQDGAATGFEFTTIAWEDSTVILTPRPDRQRAVPFRLTTLQPGRAVWENPEHDFPTLIAYRLASGDTLVARIEGPGPAGTRSSEWRMTRRRCER